ncbi:MAG: hypothetical protein AB8F95_09825 [Bacteroidia bacterium]
MNLNWQEWRDHIRKRPGMYIGSLDFKGFAKLIQGSLPELLLNIQPSRLDCVFDGKGKGSFCFHKPASSINNNTATKLHANIHFALGLLCLNALSERFLIKGFDKYNKLLFSNIFEEGKLINGSVDDTLFPCDSLYIEFQLEEGIFHAKTDWNSTFLLHEIERLAFFFPKVTIDVQHTTSNKNIVSQFHFPNGLMDMLELESIGTISGSYFANHVILNNPAFSIEIAYAFPEYSMDIPTIRSFVNFEKSPKHGTHVKGVLKGLKSGLKQYLENGGLTKKYKRSKKELTKNLLLMIHIQLKEPIFAGAVKHELLNEEILQPISEGVSNSFLNQLEEQAQRTRELLRGFY